MFFEAEQFLEKTVIEWGAEKWIPVVCLRWTHSGIDSRMQFKAGRSIWQGLVMPLWSWGWTWFDAMETMEVVLDEFGDCGRYLTGVWRLFGYCRH